jgi:UDP-N-acetyl-D-mannosaminuronic acid dehydrogenase
VPLALQSSEPSWQVRKIVVIGPGIVGMPMAALLADARIREGTTEPARVVVLQRPSPTSGWKVDAINAGRSPIGGVEPDLDGVVAETVRDGLLSATSDYATVRDADVILVCVQTDKRGYAPDYGPLFDALTGVAEHLRARPAGNVPLIVFESTLAPSSMTTVVREHFARYGLVEGRDILLGNSPNRVMPGRLVERVRSSDKIVAGLHPVTPELIRRLYSRIVTRGTLYPTNSMTAEVVKTLENAYRDVRIAFAAEVVRWCDEHDVDFYAVRDAVNTRLGQSDDASHRPTMVPSGGLLVPTVGVGGHCLPKDGILLWWRALEAKVDPARSLILEARRINDESPAQTIGLAERVFGEASLEGTVALLGVAYRFNSEDTRNSPTLALATLLRERGTPVRLHDPYVKGDDQNLVRSGFAAQFTTDLSSALKGAETAIICTAHRDYVDHPEAVLTAGPQLRYVVDGANGWSREATHRRTVQYSGIGRGRRAPDGALVDFVSEAFVAMERGLAHEVRALVSFLNDRYAADAFSRVAFDEVRRIAATCVTGCAIPAATPVEAPTAYPPTGPGGGKWRLLTRALAWSGAASESELAAGIGP